VTFIVQSQLTGVAVDLPPPLGKTAVEPMPLRFERVIDPGPARTDTIRASLGALSRPRSSAGATARRTSWSAV